MEGRRGEDHSARGAPACVDGDAASDSSPWAARFASGAVGADGAENRRRRVEVAECVSIYERKFKAKSEIVVDALHVAERIGFYEF